MPKDRQEISGAEGVGQIVESDATKSEKIRRLNRAGMARAAIARALDVRYQYVRNVLEHDGRRTPAGAGLSAAEQRRVAELTANRDTKAARIRALDAAGFSKSRIAAALGLRYQHVYNVLAPAATRADRVAEGTSTLAAAATSPTVGDADADAGASAQVGLPLAMRVVVEAGRRVAIPPACAGAIGISEGDEVVLRVADDELRIYSQETAVRRVQQLVARHVPAGVSLADELIAERRQEAAREADDA